MASSSSTSRSKMQYSQLDENVAVNDNTSVAIMEDDDDESSMQTTSLRSLSSRAATRRTHDPSLHEPLQQQDDPFYVFREDLYRKLDLVEGALSEYTQLVREHEDNEHVDNTYLIKDAKKVVKRHVRQAESTLQDVETTIQVVQSQPQKFRHVTDLYERQALVTTSKDRLTRTKAELNQAISKKKKRKSPMAASATVPTATASNGHPAAASSDIENPADPNDPFFNETHGQTSLLLQQQDETLDELGNAVTRVGDMATHISEEIGHQNKMLEEMEDDLADAEEKLGMVMGKLAKFLKTKDKWQLGTIIMLMIIVMVLVFLVCAT